MKAIAKTTESALVVSVIDEKYFTAPCFTLAEASQFTRKAQESIYEDGGDNIAGAMVYHPVKGICAWVSPNGRVWEVKSMDDVIKGGKKEFKGVELTGHFNQVFA